VVPRGHAAHRLGLDAGHGCDVQQQVRGNLADLWLARLELEPLGGDERPGAWWWPWAWAILRVGKVVACAWLWSRLYGVVRPVGEQDVRLTLGPVADSSTPRESPYRCPHPRG
jgi:hypothetical protein